MEPEKRESDVETPRMSIMGDAPKLGPRLLPILVGAIALTAIWPETWGFLGPLARVGRIAGFAIGGAGLVFWASAAAGLLRAYKADRLCTTGAYGLCRHPIFAWWVFFVLPPVALVLDSWLFLVAAALVAWAVRPAMADEEAFLIGRYGDAYRDYALRVPRLVPRPPSIRRGGPIEV